MAISIKYYFDEHMPRSVARALEGHDIAVIMAVDVDMVAKDDDTEHLPYATGHDAVLVTRDKPFAGRTLKRSDHSGLICWTGEENDVGGMVRALTQFATERAQRTCAGKCSG